MFKRLDILVWISCIFSMTRPHPSEDDYEVESKLRGKTLRIYIFLVLKFPDAVGVNEVSKRFRVSRGTAHFHLQKLVNLGLAEQTPLLEYKMLREINVGILHVLVRIGKHLWPRYLFYTVAASTATAFYALLFTEPALTLGIPGVLAMYATGLIIAVFACCILAYEASDCQRELWRLLH